MRYAPFVLCLSLLMPVAAHAQRVDQLPTEPVAPATTPYEQINTIAAIVNDDVITTDDLKARIDLAAFSSGMPRSQEIVQQLLPSVLNTLIAEQLQVQEGESKGLTVSEKEIDDAIMQLGIDNKVPNNDLPGLLQMNGISVKALRHQARAGLTWKKVVMRTIRPRVDIGDDEIEAVVERLRATNGQDEYLVSEIFLPVETPKEEDSVRKLADELTSRLKTGADFGSVARQFSQGLGAGMGGDLGWIQKGQLDKEIDDVLPTLQDGSLSDPIRSATGYHILALRAKRTVSVSDEEETSVHLKQAFRPYAKGLVKDDLLKEAEAIKAAVTSCQGLDELLTGTHPDWRLQDLGDVDLKTAPEWLVGQVRDIPEGRAGSPMATGKGALILFVCNKTKTGSETIDRNAIRTQLGSEKMEIMARRLQRDLRRDAYIDIRLK